MVHGARGPIVMRLIRQVVRADAKVERCIHGIAAAAVLVLRVTPAS